jgi:hypothetical protein
MSAAEQRQELSPVIALLMAFFLMHVWLEVFGFAPTLVIVLGLGVLIVTQELEVPWVH